MQYTYFLIDPRDDSVFYVGKGYGRRIRVHSYMMGAKEHHNPKLLSKLRKISSLGLKHEAFKIFEHKDEWPCLANEVAPIALYGRENLCNLTDGGQGVYPSIEGRQRIAAGQLGKRQSKERIARRVACLLGHAVSAKTRAKIGAAHAGKYVSAETRAKLSVVRLGKPHSEESKAKISAAVSGKNHPFFGKKHSKEAREKMSASQLGEKSHNFGKPKSEETKRKISEAKLGRTFSSEHKLNLSIAHKGIHKGENHPMFGKKHSEETRSKISRSLSQFFKKRALGAMVVVALLLSSSVFAEDLSYRVRTEILDQRNPVTVNVSTHAVTTLQFPAQIQSLESDGFTQKPNEEVGDFYISPGVNWVSIRSLKPGATQNLGVVIAGRVYEIMIQTTALNDLAVLFQFEQAPPRPAKIAPRVWSPLARNLP